MGEFGHSILRRYFREGHISANMALTPPWELLSNPAIGNLLLLIAAFVGVFGSWSIYLSKMDNRADATRRSLIAEISSNNIFDRIDDEPPMHNVYSTVVYESVGTDVALLTEEEIEAVSEVYTEVIRLKEAQAMHGELIRDAETVEAKDEKYSERNTILISRLALLDEKSKTALEKLDENLGFGHSGYTVYSSILD